MTKKKKEKETKEAFNLEEALNELTIPSMLVEGFRAYIKNNNLKINSKTDFEKSLKKFKELKL